MQQIDKIVKSPVEPNDINVLWLDTSGEKPLLKSFDNGKWQAYEAYEKPEDGIPMEDLSDEVKEAINDSKDFPYSVTKEHVTVKIRGCAWNEDDQVNEAASVTGGKVIVKSWNPAVSENYPDQEFTISANGIVEFDIQHGLHYQVHSEKSGLGTSFRLNFTSSAEEREIILWNLSLGVYNFGWNDLLYTDDDSFARLVPVICPDGSVDLSKLMDWDSDDTVYSDDGGHSQGILVSTEDCSFLLGADNKSDSTIAWSKMNYGRSVPALEEYYETNGQDFDAAVAAAKEDFDGPLNTDKIVSALAEAPAAYFCISSTDYYCQRYLPSVGELDAIYNNKADINSINSDVDITTNIDTNAYWSSCASDRYRAFYKSLFNGGVYYSNKYSDRSFYGLAVSAFLYYY